VRVAVEPERLFQYRFGIGSLDTMITWQLEADGAGTRLRLTHEGFNLDTPVGAAAFEGMGNGWSTVLDRLEEAASA
jgi:uncharacterized protein YndB with AHSA1/START domain